MNIENEQESLPNHPPKLSEITEDYPPNLAYETDDITEDHPPKLSDMEQIPDISNLVQSQKKAGEICIPMIEAEYEGWFQKLTELQEGDVINRPNCKFCNHPIRAEAEKKWEETHSYSALSQLFDEYTAEHPELPGMNMTNLRTHIMNHYEQMLRKVQVREYGSRLQDMINYKISKDKQFEALSTSLQMQYMYIAADESIDKIKQSETLVKISKALLEIIEIQARLRGELSTANVMSEKFVNVWVNMISQEKDPDRQKLLIDKLEMFRSEMAASNG